MKTTIISIVKYVLILSIGFGLLALAFRGIDLPKVIDDIMKADYFWLSLSVLVSLVAFYSRAIRWNMLIHPLGYTPAAKSTVAALMIGYLANLAVPRMGEVTRCGTLSQDEKIPMDSLIGTVIVERIVDVFSLLFCTFLVAVVEYARLGSFLHDEVYLRLTSQFSIVFENPLIVLAVAVAFIGIIYLIFRNRKSGTLLMKTRKILKGVADGIRTIRKLRNPAGFLFHTVLIWSMYFLMSYLCFSALSATSLLDWHAGLFVLVVGGMAMSAPVQGGFGTYHLLVSQGLMLYGVTKDDGVAFATLMHGSQTLVVIIFGALSYLYLFLKKRNAKAELIRNHPQ